ncbi:MAG: HEAT repeat domain-containing protein [Candidatus Micrarchaeota archaeon]|nr:HEAT repeat domain-containing protein [Candidatus Micrarchaeota archaeon]
MIRQLHNAKERAKNPSVRRNAVHYEDIQHSALPRLQNIADVLANIESPILPAILNNCQSFKSPEIVAEVDSFTPIIKSLAYLLRAIYAIPGDSNTFNTDDMFVFEVGQKSVIIDDVTLNRVFTFTGYEGRTREALCDLLIAAVDTTDNDNVRNGAYRSLGYFDFPQALDFLLDRVSKETNLLTIYNICNALRNITNRTPRKNPRIVSILLPRTTDENPEIRCEIAALLCNIRTRKSVVIAWNMLEREKDPLVRDCLFESLVHESRFVHDIMGTTAFVDALLRTIRAHINEFSQSQLSHLFDSGICVIKDIRGFVSRLSDREKEVLLTDPPKIGIRHVAYVLSYEYFKAACENRLVDVTMCGTTFSYVLVPHTRIGDFGKVHEEACAVSYAVPERFRSIIAYHEHVEGQTGSHEIAVKKELEAAVALGIDVEYKAWITSRRGERRRFDF